MLGYLTHPLVRFALLLEHGCEKTHNDYIRHQAEQRGLDLSVFGWASVQLDGGIEKVTQKIEDWFTHALSSMAPSVVETVGLDRLRLGMLNAGPMSLISKRFWTPLVQIRHWLTDKRRKFQDFTSWKRPLIIGSRP
jgi:hypothetical protein